MNNCLLCGSYLVPFSYNSFILKNVPGSTFNLNSNLTDLKIIKCGECGLVQLIDTPLNGDYNITQRSIGVTKQREKKKQELKEFIEKYKLKNSLAIEVGCGNGQFLEIFKELDLDVFGIEAGTENYKACLKKEFRVIQGTILEPQSVQSLFDVFFCFYYLEHLPYPVSFCKKLFDLLMPGGLGIIEVPSYDLIEEKNIWLEYTIDHRTYFKRRVLSRLLIECGFEIEEIKENKETLCLTIIVKKPKETLNFFNMEQQLQEDIKKLKLLTETFNEPFAVYGAGHYSQLLISLLDSLYGIKPKWIFDSNPQKCGGRIRGIEVIDSKKIAGIFDCKHIIICCGIYNEEISKTLNFQNQILNQWEDLIKWE
jgi:2-polyprenyl-3-methyl-5-hydroxy-6-metoxy-1,4-benzoquinol methylase